MTDLANVEKTTAFPILLHSGGGALDQGSGPGLSSISINALHFSECIDSVDGFSMRALSPGWPESATKFDFHETAGQRIALWVNRVATSGSRSARLPSYPILERRIRNLRAAIVAASFRKRGLPCTKTPQSSRCAQRYPPNAPMNWSITVAVICWSSSAPWHVLRLYQDERGTLLRPM
jgi:hypothetical protein